ncbi:hypothetical protein DSM104299_01145 [Baekduia alba]|uniref:pentapeptide repeat-containing protein n=1 Tax=Baekduia alba TaxID=2997333 RepID=UPI00233FE7D6|nr:pentapeptide repeat-containing protein [Baekduia alba]WCB92449.1 hypothetical protein DSM104299_01145 [Baekduia alba]
MAITLFVVVFAFVVLLVKIAADQLAAPKTDMTAAEHAEDVGRARTTVLGILAGAIAVFGAFYTHRGFLLNREGQITDRYTRAIDQLGSGSQDVRIGGIYALLLDHDPSRYPEPPPADVHAALAVLGARRKDFDPPLPWRLDLAATYLPRARLAGLDFSDADFSHAVLDQASLIGAGLSGARFVGARMAYAELHHADLIASDFEDARLFHASLEGARLGHARFVDSDCRGASLERAFAAEAVMRGANMTQANLSATDLRHVDLIKADLTDVTLSGADLTDADLRAAKFVETQADSETKWPAGFVAADHDGILIDD